MKHKTDTKNVLVGVLKDRRDLVLLHREHWYRIPKAHLPRRKFSYLAFYQPEEFGRRGKRIQYYARVLRRRMVPRRELLPDEVTHPRADELYAWLQVDHIQRLSVPIRNITPRRVSFGFTTLERLLNSRNILELYGVAPTEDVIRRALLKLRIRPRAQYYVSDRTVGLRLKSKTQQRYYLDFAVICKRGGVAIECDNKKAHAGSRQRARDKAKDAFLRQHGWTVVRLTERLILGDVQKSTDRIVTAIKRRGGALSSLL